MKKTSRPTVDALEEVLEQPFPVLDHGYLRVIDYMGDDSAIVQAARVSYGKGTKKTSEDEGLIRYLMRHRHSTPFEMCEIKFHCKMPIFVARQWIRHRTANVNEYSARYSLLDREFYIPKPEHLAVQSTSNRQGRGEAVNPDDAEVILDLLRADASRNYDHYEELIEKDNLARELARMNLTLNTYTQWYWKVDLHNLFGFLSLRADSHAQYEIRVYADIMLDIVRRWVPVAHQAFLDYRLNAVTFSAQQLNFLRYMLAGVSVPADSGEMSKREKDELIALIAG